MKKRLGQFVFPILLVPVVAAATWGVVQGIGRPEKEKLPEENPSTTHDPSAIVVTAAPVTARPAQRSVEAVGTIYGYEEVAICTKVEGRVRRILHEVSDRVKPGEVLLEIDPTDYELSVRQAEKALQVDLAKLGLKEPPGSGFDVTQVPPVMQAAARLENAKTRLNRTQRLSSRQANSAEELADKTADYQVAQAEHDNQIMLAKAGLAMIQMKQEALAIARQQLKDTVIRVPTPTQPIPGLDQGAVYAISFRDVAEGSFVRPGMEVFKLVIDRILKLRVPVPERHSQQVKLRQKADVFAAASTRPFVGTVTRINPSVEPVARTFEVEIRVPNPEGELKPGGFAKAAIFTRLDNEAPTVPLEALVSFAGVTKVFLVENGRAKEVPVTLGLQSTKWVEIAAPALAPGSQVVTSGQAALADGVVVSIRATDKK